MSRGRQAALPQYGWEPPSRRPEDGGMICRFFPEDGGPSKDYDFRGWPVGLALRLGLADAFTRLTAADGTQRTLQTAETTYSACQRLVYWLAGRDQVPVQAGQLSGALLAEYRLAKPRDYVKMRRLLLLVVGLPAGAHALLSSGNPRRPSTPVVGYSRAELNVLMATARRDLRGAADRIRGNRALLDAWLAGEIAYDSVAGRRARILEQVASAGDVPRGPDGGPLGRVKAVGTTSELIAGLHLTMIELISAAVLLIGLTGHNLTGISSLRVAHQRADGGGPTSAAEDHEPETGRQVAVVDVVKRRRGRRRRYMTVPLTNIPDWLTEDDDPPVQAPGGSQLRLDTAFGVYMLLHELTADSRAACRTDRLLVARVSRGGGRMGRHWVIGITGGYAVGLWSDTHQLASPARALNATPIGTGVPAPVAPLRLTWPRLRRSYVEHHQRGVAHTDETLANQYLVRDRGNIAEYQRVVAETLALQEERAREYGIVQTFTAEDITRFHADPEGVAAQWTTDPPTIRRLLAGQLDTALAGCVDNDDSPFTDPGPCRASFLLCLGCRNARATPQHLPAQAETLRRLQELRTAMAPDRWASRFGLAAAQLTALLRQSPAGVVETARGEVNEETRALVGRLLGGDLDSA